MFTESTPLNRCVRVRDPHGLSELPLELVLLSGVSESAHPLLGSTSPSARAMPVVLSSVDAQNLGTCTSDDTSAWCDHPNDCSGSFGAKVLRRTRTWLTPPI